MKAAFAEFPPEVRKAIREGIKEYRESGKMEEDARRIAQTMGRLIVVLTRIREAGLARTLHEIETGVLRVGPVNV